MFQHVCKVVVLAFVFVMVMPSFTAMGMGNDRKTPPIFIPKEMASEDELLEEDFSSEEETIHDCYEPLITHTMSNAQSCGWVTGSGSAILSTMGPQGAEAGSVFGFFGAWYCGHIVKN